LLVQVVLCVLLVAEASRPKVLVVGGTEFMGRLTVAHLAGQAELTMLNRGLHPNPHPAGTRHLKCDRETACFAELVAENGPWDVVVDFALFDPAHVHAVVRLGRAVIRHYIFISSDSVYMAADPIHYARSSSTDGLTEQSAVRPSDMKLLTDRANADVYGADKLAIEEVLQQAWRDTALVSTSLRLTDVMGEYENTGRQAALIRRIMRGLPIGTAIASERGAGSTRRLGVVYARDVVRVIEALIARTPVAQAVALNLGAEDASTWQGFVEMVAQALRNNGRKVASLKFEPSVDTGFVSVDFGAIDIQTIRDLLPAWQPTPVQQWLDSMVLWELENPMPSCAAHGDCGDNRYCREDQICTICVECCDDGNGVDGACGSCACDDQSDDEDESGDEL